MLRLQFNNEPDRIDWHFNQAGASLAFGGVTVIGSSVASSLSVSSSDYVSRDNKTKKTDSNFEKTIRKL